MTLLRSCDSSIGAVDGDMGDDVGQVRLKGGYRGVMHNDEGCDLAGFCQAGPFILPRITLGTKCLGRPAELTAIFAALSAQFVKLAGIPKWLRVNIGAGQRFGVAVHTQAFLSSMALSTHSPQSSAIFGSRTWRQVARS